MSSRRIRAPFPCRVVVVGGQCSKVGKTSLIVDLLQAFPDRRWTAVKITPHTEAGCPVRGSKCACARHEHTFAIRQVKARAGKGDTARYLKAGAKRAIWVQTKAGRLPDALAELASALANARSVIIESNAIVNYWKPTLYLMVLDPRNADFKDSARRVMRFADAFVFRSPFRTRHSIYGPKATKSGKPNFLHPIGHYLSGKIERFVRQRFETSCHHIGEHGESF